MKTIKDEVDKAAQKYIDNLSRSEYNELVHEYNTSNYAGVTGLNTWIVMRKLKGLE